MEEHTIGDDGFCTACYQPLAPTEGILYELSSNGHYAEVVGYTGTATKIIIADTYNGVPVTNIYEKAFQNNTTITSVVIPDSVTNIGAYAFQYCSGLSSITIPDSVTDIDAYAFDNCHNLANVLIPNSVTKIGSYAFNYCSKLSSITIPENVTGIGDSAFGNCSNLSEIHFNAISTTTGYYIFYYAGYATRNIKVVIGKNVSRIPGQLFYHDDIMSSFSPCIRSVEFEEGSICTSIGDRAFYNCSTLKSITIPNSITYVGTNAFTGCNSELFTEYELGQYLGNNENPYAILYQITNENLSTYTINENTKIIANYAFSSCDRPTSIIIPTGVTYIGDSAFSGCNSLASVVIPNSVTYISDSAFSACNSLASIEVDENNEYYKDIDGNLYTKDGKTLIQYAIGKTDASFTIPDGVKTIGYEAFYCCSSLTSIVIPNSITDIGYSAFKNCSNLTNITIGNGLTSISGYMFLGCTSLTSVTIPESVTSIGSYAFYSCKNITIKYRGTAASWNAISKSTNWIDYLNSNYKMIYNYTGD